MYALNRLFLLRALIDLAMCNRQRSEREECGKENERKKPKRALKISLNKLSVMLQSWERNTWHDLWYHHERKYSRIISINSDNLFIQVAIVAMVNHTALEQTEEVFDDECPDVDYGEQVGFRNTIFSE